MARRKKAHFAEMKQMPHVLEFPENMKGKWRNLFKNNNQIVLELACGRGEYALALARRMPHLNFIAVDIKGSRMWHGAKAVEEMGISNILFLRTRIEQLEEYFATEEVAAIWITFPDPHPRESKERKRLTSRRFLDIYTRILEPPGALYLKTDNKALFDYSLSSILEFGGYKITGKCTDVYAEMKDDDLLTGIQTSYERRFLNEGMKICFLEARLVVQ